MVESHILKENWQIRHIPTEGVENKMIEMGADMPSTVFEVLLKHNTIEDPFYGENEHDMGWVYHSDWEYTLKFDIPGKIYEKDLILLKFYGLDVICDVYLNGAMIGHTENMFQMYEFPIKDNVVKHGSKDNFLKIIFKSPTKEAQNLIDEHKIRLRTFDGLEGVPYLRKAQYSFGWDWGPKLPDIGIWKPVEIIGYNDVRIDSIYPQYSFEYSNSKIIKVDIAINPEFDIINDSEITNYNYSIKLTSPLGVPVYNATKKLDEEIDLISIDKPLLWWTHDMGAPSLYTLKIDLKEGKKIVDTLEQKLGIREIKLIRNPDEWGESFYFQINGVPLFAKGGNWIPVDQFIPRGKKLGLYELNLKYCKDANMNMVRVWGGGIYEDDVFYDYCDKNGILVWQDFPFACSLYPYFEGFFENVEREAIQNIKRLRNHASLALWCGNNEIEGLWFGYYAMQALFVKPFKKRKFRRAYFRMFEELLPSLVEKYDIERINEYWPSSPSNGFGKKKLRLIDLARGQFGKLATMAGDSHFWKVWHMGATFKAYREHNSRFMSEYGFESFPNLKTLRTFSPEDQFDFYSPIMENHQKNKAGNKKIMNYMEKRFSIPKDFEKQVILSQITQAEAMEYGVEHWRRNRNNFHCMGSLYWQINDCWPVASWSSLDYYCRWKALQYFSKRFYDPIFPNVMEDMEKVEFWISNDQNFRVALKYDWEMLDASGNKIWGNTLDLTVDPCSSKKIDTLKFSDLEITDLSNYVVFVECIAEDNVKRYGFRLLDAPKNFPLKNPHLRVELEQGKNESILAHITSERIALYVFLESESNDFLASDNYFSLKPNETRVITLKSMKTILGVKQLNFKSLQTDLKVRSLYNLIK